MDGARSGDERLGVGVPSQAGSAGLGWRDRREIEGSQEGRKRASNLNRASDLFSFDAPPSFVPQ